MKVLHIITSLEDGGAQAALYRLVRHDGASRRHVVVSLCGADKYLTLLEAAGISVVALDMPRGRLTLRGLWRLWQLLQRERPDIVQTWMYHANLVGGGLARLAGVRRVYWGLHHTDLVPGSSRVGTRVVDWLSARLSRLIPTRIAACAETARTAHISRGYAAEKFEVIPNGYDVVQFAPDELARNRARAALGWAPHVPVVGLMARWDPQKDHATFLAAMAMVTSQWPDVRIILAGRGCDAANATLTGLIGAAGLDAQVQLLGSRGDMPDLMRALDLAVLSSAYGEAFPNVVAEAMASGTPCVVTRVGDAPVIVGETGWVVPPRDPDALAAAVSAALDECMGNAAAWRQRQSMARDVIVSRFAIDTMARLYVGMWSGERT